MFPPILHSRLGWHWCHNLWNLYSNALRRVLLPQLSKLLFCSMKSSFHLSKQLFPIWWGRWGVLTLVVILDPITAKSD